MLFDRHLPALRAKARAHLPAALKSKVGESDVVQDAYLAAFLSLGEFEDRGDGSFGAWLKRILEHKVLDEVRRHAGVAMRDARLEVRLATDVRAAVPATDPPSPSVEVMAGEVSARLREAVDGLPDDYRTVVRLVHDEGLTLVAAAARMGRSPDAVRKLYGRALGQLADLVDGPGNAAG